MGYSTRSRTRGKAAGSAVSGATKVIKKAVATVARVARGRDGGKKKAAGQNAQEEFFPSNIELRTESGDTVNTAELCAQSAFVVFLYPRANTPGCTTQACGFRDNYEKLLQNGYKVYGLSYDSPKSQSSWKVKHTLPFPLLCDSVQAGLIKQLGAHKAAKGIKRSHFVVEKGGKIVQKKIQVTPKSSISEATQYVIEHPATPSDRKIHKTEAKEDEKQDDDAEMKDATDQGEEKEASGGKPDEKGASKERSDSNDSVEVKDKDKAADSKVPGEGVHPMDTDTTGAANSAQMKGEPARETQKVRAENSKQAKGKGKHVESPVGECKVVEQSQFGGTGVERDANVDNKKSDKQQLKNQKQDGRSEVQGEKTEVKDDRRGLAEVSGRDDSKQQTDKDVKKIAQGNGNLEAYVDAKEKLKETNSAGDVNAVGGHKVRVQEGRDTNLALGIVAGKPDETAPISKAADAPSQQEKDKTSAPEATSS